MLIMSNMGDQVWLMTSRHTDPDLIVSAVEFVISRQSVQLIDVRVEDPVDEANAGAFVRVLVWELDMDFPKAASEWSCRGKPSACHLFHSLFRCPTLFRPFEANVELLP